MSGSLCHVLNGHVDVDPEHVVGDEANEDKDSNMDSPDVGDGDNVKNHDDGGEDDDVDDMTMTRKKTKMILWQQHLDSPASGGQSSRHQRT